MKERREYESPEAEVIFFDSEDVITTSDEAGHVTGASPDTRLPKI